MKNFVGIDLGTTNSAICSYDGSETRIWKSPEQNDVTPSAILIDRRGHKYLGKKAYDSAPWQPDNAAMLFKRIIGTNTPVNLNAVNISMTPEECSSEILKVLFGYLPEEMRHDPDIGTVVTVPAAFNQMQKDGTMEAARKAGIGKVALMQEPVAAVMSVMRKRNTDGKFLIYDLGGGTLDIAIAESIGGRVNLLSHGGIAMCGGRDFDRALVDNIVKPWLLEHFALPEDFSASPQVKTLYRVAIYTAERAKIELSSKEETFIGLDESFVRVRDKSGDDIYIDIPLQRSILDELIAPKVDESIEAARDAMEKAGISPDDVERIVFVGGPTNYQPLREKVAFELGIAASTDVNPMTAVSEGAAVFAESIDWSSQSRGRKSSRGAINTGGQFGLNFNFISRTPKSEAKIAVKMTGPVNPGAELQVDSLYTGWSSGRISLKDGAIIEVALAKPGENVFKVFAFDSDGDPVKLENDKIIITRTAGSIVAIPASSSIAFEVLAKVGGSKTVLDFIVKEGDPLPKKGTVNFKSTESLRAGGAGSLNFKLWEGEIDDPVTDNEFIGALSITGSHFDEGVIVAGSELVCEYKILDSGNVVLDVSVSDIRSVFHGNFYSREVGAIDFSNASKQIIDEADSLHSRVESMASRVNDSKLDQATQKIEQASSIQNGESDPETAKQAMDNVHDAKKLLAQVRKEHLKEIRQLDLDHCVDFFNGHIRQYARPTEANSFDNLIRTAQLSIDNNNPDFENHLDELRNRNFQILWRQDWFVIDRFKMHAEESYRFPDKNRHAELVSMGVEALKADDIDKLRQIVAELATSRIGSSSDDDMLMTANIVKG